MTQSTGDATLPIEEELAGDVDVDFKSDFFPLERIADSFDGSARRSVDAAVPRRAVE